MPSIIDEIYEAAVVPDLWFGLLDRLAEIGGGEGTLMFAAENTNTQYISSQAIQDYAYHWANDWLHADERTKRLIPIDEPRFLTDLDAFAPEEIEAIPVYRDFFYKWGLGWCVGTAVRSPDTSTVVFAVQRRTEAGPAGQETVAALDALRPHLARAAILSAKVGLQRAWSSVMALEAVGLPAAVLTGAGKTLAANPSLLELAPDISIGAHDRLLFSNSALHALFVDSLAFEKSGTMPPRALSFPLSARERAPAVVHLVPLRGAGRDIFSGASLLLYVTVLAQHATLPTALLQALFDLTPAEAKVARLLGSGASVAEVAQQITVQTNTVRAHLKAIFSKTGTRRQADLIGIVNVPALPRIER
jgi:DNA-binding CsgD family transcriptional regulator